MQNPTIDTVIFDLGGVLIDWNPRYLYRKIFDDVQEMEHFLANICTSDWNEEQDAGRTLAEATQILVDQFPEKAEEIKAFYGRWEEMLNGPIQGTVEIFRQIKEQDNHRLYALTNWSAETFPIAIERYEFLQWFEGILVSGVEMLKKPDPKIYQLILNRYEIEPTRSIFIDDNAKNIKAAAEQGIHAIHFQSPEALALQLKNMNIL